MLDFTRVEKAVSSVLAEGHRALFLKSMTKF